MKHILIFGASGSHGTGGEHGGWSDKLKQYVHEQMYGPKGNGELCNIYELGIPGNSSADVLARMESEIKARMVFDAKPSEVCIILAVGGNDSRASETPDNFMNTPEGYAQNFGKLVQVARRYAEQVVCLGHTPVDEAKTNPKRSPSGSLAYFTNERMQTFEAVIRSVAQTPGVTFLPLFKEVPEDWQTRCLYADGLHPNDAGHQWIFERLRSSVDTVLS